MAKIRLVRTGYVIQIWDTEKKKFVEQEFIAEDSAPVWETEDGDPTGIPAGYKEPLAMNMMQP